MEYTHLPLSLLGRTVLSLGQQRCSVQRHVSKALLAALTPLVLGGAIAPAAMLLPSQPAQAQSAEASMIQRNLQLGDRGADVLRLQKVLIQRGLLNISIPRNAQVGYFGPATKIALQDYQRAERDLIADGVLGEETFRRLFGMGLTPTKTYSIALMQAQLSELGYYDLRLDGEFGPITRRALEDLRDEAFVPLDTRSSGLEATFDAVSDYYDEQRQRQDLPHPDVLESRVERQLPEDRLFAWSGNVSRSERIVPASTSVAAVTDRSVPYRVIVPLLGRGNDRADEADLKALVGPVMVTESSRLGRYVQVGAYDERGNAEEMVDFLRSERFDARVVYN